MISLLFLFLKSIKKWFLKNNHFLNKNSNDGRRRRYRRNVFNIKPYEHPKVCILKNSLTPRDNQLFWAYFLRKHDGLKSHKVWKSLKPSKIKDFIGFWGRFSKLKKIRFNRWHSFFGVRKWFWGSEIGKSHFLFSFLKIDKKVLSPNITIF